MLGVGRHPVIRVFEHRRSEVGRKALKLLVVLGLENLFQRSGTRTENR